MLRSNSKKVNNEIRGYIMKGISPELYGYDTITDYKTACEFVMSVFYEEKVKYDKRKIGYQELFIEWMSGLASALNSLYYIKPIAKNIIAEWLQETDDEKEKYSETDAEELISKLLFREIFKACEYQVKVFDKFIERKD